MKKVFFIITINSMNLIDGIDGLSSGIFIIFCLSMLVVLQFIPVIDPQYFILISIFLGAITSFFIINYPPAKIFLGDTGALAIGAALGTLAVLLKKEILLFMIGGVFVAESLSVMMQVYYFRYTKKKYGEGKRIFRMAPLHHHFELLGWPENHVVVRFWIIGVLLALISLTTFKVQ